MIDLLSLLCDSGDVVYLAEGPLTRLADDLALADSERGEQIGVVYKDGSRATLAEVPDLGIRCFLSLSTAMGYFQHNAATANFILLANRCGCEYIEPVSLGDFSLIQFARLKDHLWGAGSEQPSGEAPATVLQFYVPRIELISQTYSVDLSLLKKILRLRANYASALGEWHAAPRQMKQVASERSIGELLGRTIPLSDVLKKEFLAGSNSSAIRSIALTLLGMALPPLVSLAFLADPLYTRYQNLLAKNTERQKFYFYLQSLSDLAQLEQT